MTALAVVIVAHDSAADLARTLPPILEQLRPADELVVVDNGRNGPLSLPDRATPAGDGSNLGFAGGAGLGARSSTAPLLLFLNPDAFPAPGCLDALREAPEEWAAWQALVVLPDGGINTSGNVAHWTGLAWAGVTPPRGPREVGFASGAALVVRRADWDAVGGFDRRYFMYGEDLDLCLRLRLAGRGVGVLPDARVEHAYTYRKGDYKWFYLERNRWWTLLSVYPAGLLVLLAPALLALELVLVFVAARQGWLGAKLRAQAAVLRSLPAVLARRRTIRRTIGARAFAAGLSPALDSPYLRVPALADRAQAAYWAAVLRALR